MKKKTSPKEPDAKEKIRETIGLHAERARVSGFIRLGHLPNIFVHEQRYPDTLLDRLWKHFECDFVPQARSSKTTYEMWFWIFRRWAGIPDNLWKACNFTPLHLPLYDPETRELKKERYGRRSDLDIVMLEDLKKYIENISKKLNIDFPLPSLLYPGRKEDRPLPFSHSDDFFQIWFTDEEPFPLTKVQAQSVKILSEQWKKGTPVLHQMTVIEQVSPDTSTTRLRDLFTGNRDAYKKLIESVKKPKGGVRLRS
jgi:hypothetical protein